MKLFLCYPPVHPAYDRIRDAGVAPHMSLLCLGTHIRHTQPDVDVVLCDGHQTATGEMESRLDAERPDIVGMSVDFTNYDSAVRLADAIKRKCPRAYIILGSNHASNMYAQILHNRPSIDFICRNDGEDALDVVIRYCKGELPLESVPNLVYRKDGHVVANPLKTFDLAQMQPVDYSLIEPKSYFPLQKSVFGDAFRMLQFTTQRGCANKPLCVFCGRYDDGIRLRDPKVCAQEIAYYVEKYQLTEVWDRSDSFIQNVDWLRTFAKELNARTDRFTQKQTTFKTYSRADQLLRQDVIDILKSLHFRMVFIGYEAGDDRILRNIGKHASVDTYLNATRLVLENGIDIDASFILGLPGENRESLGNHVRFVERLIDMGLDKIRVNRLLVLPGTPLYRKLTATFPQYADRDSIPMDELQHRLFETDLYDLSDFGGSTDTFIGEIEKTARIMTDMVIRRGGGAEGYGHGKGGNILTGKENTHKGETL